MNKRRKKKRVVTISLLVLVALVAVGIVCVKKFDLKDKIWLIQNVSIETSENGQYKVIKKPKKLSKLNLKFQTTVANKLKKEQKNKDYTTENPLMVLNPFGTNVTGMYVYFNTKEPTAIEYTISVPDEDIPDYTNTLANASETGYSKIQEGQLIGLIQGKSNTINLKAVNKAGDILEKSTITIDVPDFKTVKETKIPMEVKTDGEELTPGLFVTFGYDRRNKKEKRHYLFYDNNGIIRGEIPNNAEYEDVKLQFIDDMMFYAYSSNEYFMIDSMGQIHKKYSIDGYESHHDFEYDGDNKIVILANKSDKATVEEIVLSLELDTGKVTEILDFETIMPDIYDRAILPEGEKKLDWIHFNTVDIIDGDDLLLSSRELSTIIRINDVYTEPKLSYFIADKGIWEGTPYESLVLDKVGDFSSQTGQHTVTYQGDETLPEGQYYIYMFNNNFGYSSTWPDFDWSYIPGVGLEGAKAKHSMYYKYLVDDTKGTYELVNEIKVPYSRIVSSTQEYGDNYVICSGVGGNFGEYNADGELIAQYKLDVELLVYRVFKESMKGFWF